MHPLTPPPRKSDLNHFFQPSLSEKISTFWVKMVLKKGTFWIIDSQSNLKVLERLWAGYLNTSFVDEWFCPHILSIF